MNGLMKIKYLKYKIQIQNNAIQSQIVHTHLILSFLKGL
jgi:hypothetical protein